MLLCLLAVTAFVAACGDTSGDDAEGASETPQARAADTTGEGGTKAAPLPEAADGEKLTIGFSNYAGVIPFYQSMIAGVEETAKDYRWDVVVTDSQFDPAKQLADVDSLITRGVDLIIISPADEDALLPAYKAAKEAGIPMISIANRLNSKEKAWENAFIGMDLVKMGAIETEELIKAMGGSGKILRIMGPSGIAFVRDSVAGSDQVLAESPDIEIATEQNAKAITADEGFRIAQDALTANPDIKGIWAQEDEIATGAVRAVEDRDLDIPVSWNGGTPAAMDLAADGKLVGIVLGAYDWGKTAVDLIHGAVVGGQELPFETEADNFRLESPEAAQDLIADCPQNPMEAWCLGRK